MRFSPIMRRHAAKLLSKANRADDRACNAGQDSAALLVQRADTRARRAASAAGLTLAPASGNGGLVLLRRGSVRTHVRAMSSGAECRCPAC
jgi:hypothetical protein